MQTAGATGSAFSFVICAQNEGFSADQLRLTARSPVPGDGWQVRYFDAEVDGTDITTAITGDGWLTPELPQQGAYRLRADVTLTAAEAPGYRVQSLITAVSTTMPREGQTR